MSEIDLRGMLANDAYSQAVPMNGQYLLEIDPNDESSQYLDGTVDPSQCDEGQDDTESEMSDREQERRECINSV